MDYWRSQPGQKGVKVDWRATWRNWMRTAMERAPGGGRVNGTGQQKPKYPTAQERQAERSRTNQELGEVAERMADAAGLAPGTMQRAEFVVAKVQEMRKERAQTGSAPRTAMPYIDGEVVSSVGSQWEVTSGGVQRD